jgi:hypothetical protein
MTDNAFQHFSCSTKKCEIDSKSWRSCKWCRFEKCIASGLKPDWVFDKTIRKRRRVKKTPGVKKKMKTAIPQTTEQNHGTEALAMVRFINPITKGSSLAFSYTTNELMQIMSIAIGVHRDLTKNLTQFFGKNPTLFGQIARYNFFYHIVQVDLVICIRFVPLFWTANTEFANKKTDFD